MEEIPFSITVLKVHILWT